MNALDKLGRPIASGDFIVYRHALGRSAALKIGKVLEVKWVNPTPWDDKAAADACRIRVQGVDDGWSHKTPELSKPGTLQFPERTIVVQTDQVPSHIRALFEVSP